MRPAPPRSALRLIAFPQFSLPRAALAALLAAGTLATAPLAAPGLAPAFAQAAAAKPYARDDLASDVIRLEETLRKESATPFFQGRSASALTSDAQALVGSNPDAAMRSMGAAVAVDPRPASIWAAYLALAQRAEKPDGWRNYTLWERATTAAYAVYLRSDTPQAKAGALASLARMFEKRQMWRPALDAFSASLALAETPQIRRAYAELRATHGFRILDYKVDSDSASPRICFQFSESLARKADFAPYVSVAGAASGALGVEDQQLCIDGVKHASSYKIVIRQGLPSAVGEDLLKNSDYEIQVRDRSPQARFTGKNYVLPKVGQEGLPVVTVNTSKVLVDLFRIGERSLAPTLRGEDFLKQIAGYRAAKIASETGVKVWSGTLETKNDLNKDVVTAFPVLEAAPKLEAGVYVMTARVDGAKGTAGSDEEDYSDRATQWFIVSDIGLTAISGSDGLTAVARSLSDAAPKAGVELSLIARNNEILGKATTDARGVAKFDPGLSRGTGGMAPGVLVAADGKGDHGFLDLATTAFDFTDRGVKGRLAPTGLDAFAFPERGVYRPGETVYLTALLRDARGTAMPGLPVTLVAQRPDGVEYKRALVEDHGMGGRAWSLPLLGDAPTGSWKIKVYADPKGQPIGEAGFLVEDYVPERLEVVVKPLQEALRAGSPAEIEVQADYLYGAPGSDLDITGEVMVRGVEGGVLAGHPGYVAGVTDEAFETAGGEISEAPKTDAKGRSVVTADIPEASAPRPLEARITLRVGEPGGRAVERVTTLPIRSGKPLIGVKKLFADNLQEGAQASFEAIALTAAGQRAASPGAFWTLYRVTTRYQWHNSDGEWGYEPVKSTRKLADGSIDIPADAPGRIAAQVDWGAYRLDVKSADGEALTSVSFTVGWSGDATAETPDLLEVSLDKKAYASGDAAKLTVNARAAGSGFAAIVADGVRELIPLTLKQGENVISVPVKGDWGAGAYALVSAHRPLDVAARRMPGRAIGLAWFSIDAASRDIQVSINTPDRVRPRGALAVPVKLGGLAPGEDAYVTISAVDIGILNITKYKTPDGNDFFFGQRQLSDEVRDLYGYLIDGMQGSRGAIRSGGDGGAEEGGNRPTQEPLARYSGVLKANAQGEVEARFDLPAFNGAVRVAVAAWTKGRAGKGEKDVIVRDPVVVQGTTPRFLSLGDRSRFHLAIDNVEGASGDYTIDVDLRGPITAEADALSKSFRLAQGGKTQFSAPVMATGVGRAEIDVTLKGPGIVAPQTFAVNVQPGTSDLQRRSVRPLGPGESATISGDLLADFLPRTGKVSVSLSPFGSIDAAALIASLDLYPYGCTEQTVSRALPLLYLSNIASYEKLAIDGDVKERVKAAIERVLSRQDSSGDFGLWSAGGAQDMWLNAFTLDFLTRAREQGYEVPQRAFDLGLERLRNYVANTSDADRGDGSGLAYSYYVLARNGRPVMGDLRYLADAQLATFKTSLGRMQLGAALALLGDRPRAQTLFTNAVDQLVSSANPSVSRADYGSKLRDGAAAMALIAESGSLDGPALQRANAVVGELQGSQRYTSTQEKTWMVMAAQALAKAAESFSATLDGQPVKGALNRTWRDLDLATGSKTIVNNSPAPAQLVVTAAGNPIVPEGPASQGYDIERTLYRLDGKPVTGPVKQNERLAVVLKVTEREAKYARLLLVDRLPAGLEIDNPKLVESGSLEGLNWFKQDVAPDHTEYRDDRFVAAFDREGKDRAVFSVAYLVRAVTPGRYVLPPAVVEDMYRPERFGRNAYSELEVSER